MTQKLSDIANNDTPQAVQVPATWRGLSAWMVTRLGIGTVFLYMLYVVYGDLRAITNQMLVQMENQARINAQQTAAIAELARTIEQLRR